MSDVECLKCGEWKHDDEFNNVIGYGGKPAPYGVCSECCDLILDEEVWKLTNQRIKSKEPVSG